jgi:predicted SnoaL-like aldol condensation-catalyzing enzyme
MNRIKLTTSVPGQRFTALAVVDTATTDISTVNSNMAQSKTASAYNNRNTNRTDGSMTIKTADIFRVEDGKFAEHGDTVNASDMEEKLGLLTRRQPTG